MYAKAKGKLTASSNRPKDNIELLMARTVVKTKTSTLHNGQSLIFLINCMGKNATRVITIIIII